MRVSIELEPNEGQLHHLRRLVSDWAQAIEADEESVMLIATELVTNALAASPGDRPIVVWLDHTPGEAQVSVMDEGVGLDSGSRSFDAPPASALRGRGLAIVNGLSERVEIHSPDGGTVVTAATKVPD